VSHPQHGALTQKFEFFGLMVWYTQNGANNTCSFHLWSDVDHHGEVKSDVKVCKISCLAL
jgi:hypothetical protein